MKKQFFVISILIVLFCAAVWGTVFSFKCRSFQAVFPAETEVHISSPVPTGEVVLCSYGVDLPWFSQVEVTNVNSDNYAVVSGTPEIKNSKRGAFLRKSVVSIKLRAVEPGTVKDANFTLQVKTPGKAVVEQICRIPEFQISEPTEKNITDLQLAEKETPPKHNAFWKYAAAILAVLAAAALILGAVWYFKLRRKSRQMSEWEKARRDLEMLRGDIEEKRISPENGFIRLTDLVRRYLEKRFGLPVTRRTTQEFLDNISDSAAQKIPAESKPFLKNFLSAADQVKFARASADTSLLAKAVTDASRLIDSTCPAEEEIQNV